MKTWRELFYQGRENANDKSYVVAVRGISLDDEVPFEAMGGEVKAIIWTADFVYIPVSYDNVDVNLVAVPRFVKDGGAMSVHNAWKVARE